MSPHFTRSLLCCSRKHRASCLSGCCPSCILRRWSTIHLFFVRLQGLSWRPCIVSILIDQTNYVSGTRIFTQFSLRSFTGFLCWIVRAKLSASNCRAWLFRSQRSVYTWTWWHICSLFFNFELSSSISCIVCSWLLASFIMGDISTSDVYWLLTWT